MKAVESVILFVSLVTIGACIDEDLSQIEDQNTIETAVFPLVDQELWSHFIAFEDAAEDRGFRVDLSATQIRGTIEEIHEDNIAGTCSFGGRTNFRDVVIDESFWDNSSQLSREYIVFHELGHCFLGRDHEEACLANRSYASLMRSGLGSCRDNYNFSTRDYYLDELFGVLTP